MQKAGLSLARAAVAVALVAGLCICLTPCMGSWPGDMIAPFRIQLAVAAVTGMCIALLLRDRRIIVLAAVVAAAALGPMAIRMLDRPILPKTATGHTLSFVFSNVLCDNHQYARVVALARTENSDIFAAAETTPEWIAHLDAIKTQYPYSFAPTTLGIFGVALYAKRPFSAVLYRIGRHRMPLIRADFGNMVVYVAHPMPPANERLTFDNRQYIEDLSARVGGETRPVIIAGDLNTTLWSANIKPLLHQQMQWPAGSGLAYSWPAQKPWMAIQIDQILTKGLKAGTYRTLQDVGSDHYPVRAELVL